MNSNLARKLAWCALGCWLVSWFLPVVDGYAGWGAFLEAIESPFRDPSPTRGEIGLTLVASAMTNVAFVALFLPWIRGDVKRHALFAKLALFCLILDLFWLVEMLRASESPRLLVGYYAWIAGFALLAAAGFVSAASDRRTSKTPTAGTPS